MQIKSHLVRVRARVVIALPCEVVSVPPKQVLEEGRAGLHGADMQIDLNR
jgi:hypothetical protein